MTRPNNSAAVVNPVLGIQLDEYKESMGWPFIAGRVMPRLPVALSSSTYPVIPKEVLLKVFNTKRAPRGTYPKSDWNFEIGQYATQENGWVEYIDERERKLYAHLIDAEMIASKRALKIILRNYEQRVADKVFDGSRFSAHAVSKKWSSATDATPIDDVADAQNAVELQCGMTPNTLIISADTFRLLKRTDQLVEQIKHTYPGVDIQNMTSALAAQALGVENLLVGGGVYDSAKTGKDASIARIWPSDEAMLTIVSNDMDPSVPCIGRTFYWLEESGEGEANTIVETYWEEDRRSNAVRVRHDSDERLIASYDDNGSIQSDIADAVSYRMTNIQ